MAERLSDVQARLHTLHDLQDIVGAMRAMAAARVQEAQMALDGTRAYAEVVGDALAEALPLLPAAPASGIAAARAPTGIVLFMAEHGFTGSFNDELMDAARLATSGGQAVFVVGNRGRVLLEERGLAPAWATDMAIHAGAVTDTARRTATALYHRFERGAVAAVEILYFRDQGGGRRAVERQSLLPVDFGRFQQPRSTVPPLTNLAPHVLIGGLVGEYVFAQLAHAAMESFASENATRLAAMRSAREKLDERLGQLQGLERRLRQEQITSELLEIVIGADAAL
ncbi:MAG TPA: F0F1 ATP synthase subunit gamma [Geminicoccaceae bacterium]|nr:F0F1 ATP synthase subunit gamma [Geminicoccaceae bacterium]